MKNTIWLTSLTALVLTLGGCAQPEAQPITIEIPPPPITVQRPEAIAEPVAIVPTAPTTPSAVVIAAESPAASSIETPRTGTELAPAEKIVTGSPLATPPKQAPQPTPTPVKPTPVKPTAVAPTVKASVATVKPVIFEASYGRVTFDHQQHAASQPCTSCHGTKPPVKFALGEDKAHQLCKACHRQKGVPTQCTACHKKG